jgi:hypothetical protein
MPETGNSLALVLRSVIESKMQAAGLGGIQEPGG